MNTLYVPIGVELFLMGENAGAKNFMSTAPKYSALKSFYRGERLACDPFQNDNPLPAGVHLHFILPDALTHAQQKQGRLTYPRIPDRWIVARLETKETKIKINCWVIESDYIGLNNTKSIPIPCLEDKENICKFLGYQYELESSPPSGSDPVGRFALTAVGSGDAAFAAFYPSCRTVLGFHDALDGYNAGDFTYLVAGYYDNPANDPLHGLNKDDAIKLLDDYKWHVDQLDAVPERIVCHSMIYNVKWQGAKFDYPSGEPTGNINAAIGNTSAEALAALVCSERYKRTGNITEPLERFLTVLQNDLVDTMTSVDGIAEVEELLHKETFDPESAGNIWCISHAGEQHSDDPPLPSGAGAVLSKLNQTQREQNQTQREKKFLQQMLFVWWNLFESRIETKPSHPTPTQVEVKTEINRLIAKYDELESLNGSLSAKIETLKKSIGSYLNDAHNQYILKEIPDERFYLPKDPVLLLAGKGISRPYAFGQDGRLRGDGMLKCRLGTVSGLRGSTSLDKSELLKFLTNVPHHTLDCLTDLFCETICVCPPLKDWVVSKANLQHAEPVGEMPSQIALNGWTQSWVTLFLEWKVGFAPTRKKGEVPDNSMNGWKLGKVDYQFEGIVPETIPRTTGRTVLTPLSTLLLANVLRKYLKTDNDPKLRELLKKVEQLSVVSQRMGGFGVELLSKKQTVQVPIMTKSKDEATIQLAQKVADRLSSTELMPGDYEQSFLPIRAGFLSLERVSVCSTFGLRQDVHNINYDNVVFSEHLPSKDHQYGAMPPRLSQGARILFEPISQQDKTVLSGLPRETSPICGYLVTDILNLNLLVFNQDGIWLGMLRGILKDNKICGGGGNAPGKTREDLSNEHLKGFVEGIEQHGTVGDPAFGALMKQIDSQLLRTTSKETGDSLASLWGRPLALIRAQVSMQLLGTPAYSLSIEKFGKYDTGAFEKIRYPLLVGDMTRMRDGIIGYFCDTDESKGYDGYRKMYCAAKASASESHYLEDQKKATVSPGDQVPTYMTIMAEPASLLSVRSGILPVAHTQLLAEHYQDTLNRLYFALETNPVISELPSSDEVFLPAPKESDGDWSWCFSDSQGGFTERSTVLSPEAVFHSDSPQIMDGYLIRRSHKQP